MSDHDDDPFAGEELEPKSGRKKRRADPTLALVPDETGPIDVRLACKPLNDFGNGVRLKERFGDELMAVKNIGWFAWATNKWDLERGDAEATIRAHRVAELVAQEAKALKLDRGSDAAWAERVERLYAWSIAAGNMGRARAMLDAAEPYLGVPIEALDHDPFLAACANGTIKLKQESSLRDSVRTDRITRELGASFDPEARCPEFDKFIARILPDEEMRAFLQRIAGSCLCGSTRDQKFFIFWGGGNNGKSTLLNTLGKVLGDYWTHSPIQTFLAKREGNSGADASPDLARLPGARLVTASEPPEGARLDEARIKEMTGGDPMIVRHLNKGFFQFNPCFKLIISTNHQPSIRGTDRGIWRRVLLVPFLVEVPRDEIDPELPTKLMEERDGILRWMIAGFESWLTRGLSPPERAIAATESYRADQDPVGEFLKGKCERTGDGVQPSTGRMYEIDAKALRSEYKLWCEDQGIDPLPAKTFGGKLRGHGIEKRNSNGRTLYIGLHWLGQSAE